ncbi:hypothetical protein [Hydrocoleum sp. CS-953]|nr:hypothetical protein [Hydrocoleum sp. CS-953]
MLVTSDGPPGRGSKLGLKIHSIASGSGVEEKLLLPLTIAPLILSQVM